jgi:hypothetical protein
MARLILYMALICWAAAKPVSEDYYYRMLVLPIYELSGLRVWLGAG